MKRLLILAMLAPFFLQAQLLKSVSSKVEFYSEAPIENIEAVNDSSTGAIRTSDNMIALRIPIVNFDFEKELMEEHFNENYMESGKFKTASFKGTINEKIKWNKDGEYEASATGVLNIHGVEQKRTIKGKLIIKDGEVKLDTKFQVKLVDHNIKIPQAVLMNIAEVIDVTFTMTLK